MNRELKFRFWKDGKRYKSDVRLDPECPVAFMFDGEHQFISSTMLVEQYTGLKDKNGVEIYEGDIVRASGNEGTVYPSRYEACFRDGKFICVGIGKKKRNMFIDLSYTDAEFEVIGNIHENSELLEEE